MDHLGQLLLLSHISLGSMLGYPFRKGIARYASVEIYSQTLRMPKEPSAKAVYRRNKAARSLSNVLREGELYGVSAAPGGFAWTCGINRQIAGPDQPLVEDEINQLAPPPPWRLDRVFPPVPWGRLYGTGRQAGAQTWAVGIAFNPPATSQALAVRRISTSRTWRVVPVPAVPDFDGITGNEWLYGVAPAARDEVWAVGETKATSPIEQNLILRWDGAVWNVVPVPQFGRSNGLRGVDVVNRNFVWAVGGRIDTFGAGSHTHILRWDGTAWTQVPSPDASVSNWLNSVTVTSATDAWAVGASEPTLGPRRGLILHWDGTNWQLAGSSIVGELRGVSAASSSDVWAVGHGAFPLLMHWDGGQWKRVITSPFQAGDLLNAVHAVAWNDVWVVGARPVGIGAKHLNTLTVHWDGIAWTVVPSP